jgi:hypothetical protein
MVTEGRIMVTMFQARHRGSSRATRRLQRAAEAGGVEAEVKQGEPLGNLGTVDCTDRPGQRPSA